jgi:plasmid stabilization system protein ParE
MDEVLISAAAEREYADSLKWYAQRSRQAAEGFQLAFAAAISAIEGHPTQNPLIDRQHRAYMLRGYPYRLIYRSTIDCNWLIIAVAHTSRDPDYWRERK